MYNSKVMFQADIAIETSHPTLSHTNASTWFTIDQPNEFNSFKGLFPFQRHVGFNLIIIKAARSDHSPSSSVAGPG